MCVYISLTDFLIHRHYLWSISSSICSVLSLSIVICKHLFSSSCFFNLAFKDSTAFLLLVNTSGSCYFKVFNNHCLIRCNSKFCWFTITFHLSNTTVLPNVISKDGLTRSDHCNCHLQIQHSVQIDQLRSVHKQSYQIR